MAGEDRKSATALKEELLSVGRSFSFFQTMRLLNRFSAEKGSRRESGEVNVSNIKIRPNLSLSFPTSDVEKVEETETGKFTLTANILGLYGTCSPLPTFYTEELFDDISKGNTTTRDFVDVINHRLYELLFAGWSKYRSMLKIVEEKSPVHTDRLFSIIGLGEEELRTDFENPLGLLRYTGLFAMNARSASGLETLLSDALDGTRVTIVQAVERKGVIPKDQRALLGGGISLGKGSYLGSEYSDRTGAFRIQIGPVSDEEYRLFFPGGKKYNILVSLTKLYVHQPFEYDMEVILDKNEQRATASLGAEKGSNLGLDTWVFSHDGPKEFRTLFYLENSGCCVG